MSNGGPVLALTEGYGVGLGSQLPFTLPDGGAGLSITQTQDGLGLRRLLSLVFTLTTSATVAARVVTVEYQGKDGNAFMVAGTATTVPASQTQRFSASVTGFQGGTQGATTLFFSLPTFFLFPGDVLTIAVGAIQAADTVTKIRGVFELFPLSTDRLPPLEP